MIPTTPQIIPMIIPVSEDGELQPTSNDSLAAFYQAFHSSLHAPVLAAVSKVEVVAVCVL